MKVGIVGAEAAKFTAAGEAEARRVIRALLDRREVTHMVSGGCHLGGADIYAEEIARELGVEPLIFKPRTLSWASGYKPRNLQIAEAADELHNIVVERLPASFTGMRFPVCYHCEGRPTPPHVKSGGCWTAWRARERGKPIQFHIVRNLEDAP